MLGAVPRAITRARREPPPEIVALSFLVVLAVGILIVGVTVSADAVPPSTQVLPLLFGGLLLGRSAMRQLILVVTACLLWDILALGIWEVRPGALVALGVTGVIAYEFSRSREETGLGGLRGDSVLVELRRRLEMQGALPDLAQPWCAETVLRPAGGGPFAGDFVVSACADEGRRLDLALVDVSGKGVEAGARALLLSGALGGLLDAMTPGEFLPAANRYLFAQDWDEGFATAVHLSLDLVTGAYLVESAGHPPTAHFDAGSGRWSLLDTAGPALGLVPAATYESDGGFLRPGDALLLYTDGLVEVPGRDLTVGIDKLLGAAEHLVARGFHGGADVLVDQVAADSSDDRGLVLIWRAR
ncbi:MAG: serine phosphatase [Frankiales bacterium]|nr:serine phosphatase [Frankiales bacterium]